MKYRYKIEQIKDETNNEKRWRVIDKETKETKQNCDTRAVARDVAKSLNTEMRP